MKKKKKWMVLAFLLCVSLLSSCSPLNKPPSPQKAVISVWSYYTPPASLIEDFGAENPDIEVEYTFIPWADYEERVMQAIVTGGELPDIVVAESYWWGKWLQMEGVFTDLRTLGMPFDRLPESVLDTCINTSGEYVVLPVSFGIAAFWYCKSLAKEVFGDDSPEYVASLVRSWDDLFEVGQKVKNKSNGNSFLFPDTMALEEMLVASDKPYIVDDTLLFTEKIVPIFNLIQQFLQAGYIAGYSGLEIDLSLLNENILFYPSGDWYGANIMENDPNGKGKWDVVPPPGDLFFRGGYGHLILETSTQKEAAAAYLQYYLSKDGSSNLVSQVPAFIGSYDDIQEVNDAQQPNEDYFPRDVKRIFYDWYLNMEYIPSFGKYDDLIEKILRVKAYDMMTAGIDAKTVLSEAYEELREQLPENIRIE